LFQRTRTKKNDAIRHRILSPCISIGTFGRGRFEGALFVSTSFSSIELVIQRRRHFPTKCQAESLHALRIAILLRPLFAPQGLRLVHIVNSDICGSYSRTPIHAGASFGRRFFKSFRSTKDFRDYAEIFLMIFQRFFRLPIPPRIVLLAHLATAPVIIRIRLLSP